VNAEPVLAVAVMYTGQLIKGITSILSLLQPVPQLMESIPVEFFEDTTVPVPIPPLETFNVYNTAEGAATAARTGLAGRANVPIIDVNIRPKTRAMCASLDFIKFPGAMRT
jgi:hypothetical protein